MSAVFKEHTGVIDGITFSPNGHSLVSGSDDQSVRIWSLRDGSSKVMPVFGRIGYFLSVAFSPDGRYIAGANYNNSLWIWNSRTHKLVAMWRGHSYIVNCVEFTPGGQELMSGSHDRTVKCWDVSSLGTGPESQNFPEIRAFFGHTVRFFMVSF